MARRGRHRRSPDAISHRSLDDSLFGDQATYSPLDFLSIDDARTYHPDLDFRTIHEVDGRRIRPLQVARPSKSWSQAINYFHSYPSSRTRFAIPDRTIVCVRRKQRREVFFAKKLKRGRGGGRRTRWSDVSCR